MTMMCKLRVKSVCSLFGVVYVYIRRHLSHASSTTCIPALISALFANTSHNVPNSQYITSLRSIVCLLS